MKVLSGHYSVETSFVQEDYPYGFKLRCARRVWLEVNKNGTRFCAQTSNPKKPYLVCNAPKKSTYMLAGALFLKEDEAPEEERGHVAWEGWSPYHPEKARSFLNKYREGLTQAEIALCERVATVYEDSQAKEASKRDDSI